MTEYQRLTPQETRHLFFCLNITPKAGEYQKWVDDALVFADPLGLHYYLNEGMMGDEVTGYMDLALALDLPVAYVIGFDIAFEGEDVKVQVPAAGLDIDLADFDLWHGVSDGLACRRVLIGKQEVAS